MLATIVHACGTTTTSAVTGTTGGSFGPPLAMGPIFAVGLAIVILGAAIIAVVTVFALTRSSTPRALPVPIGATVSPDGFYWWDGAAWRPVY